MHSGTSERRTEYPLYKGHMLLIHYKPLKSKEISTKDKMADPNVSFVQRFHYSNFDFGIPYCYYKLRVLNLAFLATTIIFANNNTRK